MTSLREGSYAALMENDPPLKCQLVAELHQRSFDQASLAPSSINDVIVPGRPEKPELVTPKLVKKRGLTTQLGRNHLMHALAHIEFNAINLALDAIYRFSDQPNQFYLDWLSVAADEARHFLLVCNYLQHDIEYGDFPAHDGLWDMCRRTSNHVVDRMALVPRVLEARGLDVSPALIEKLKNQHDNAAAEVINTIYHDEIEHVRIGSKWFNHQCEQQNLDPQKTFFKCIEKHLYGDLRGPFNLPARQQAGFSEIELENIINKYS